MKGIYPHPSKNRGLPETRYWRISLGGGKRRQWVTFEGSFLEAAEYKRLVLQYAGGVDVPITPTFNGLFLPFLDWYKTESSPRTVRDVRYSINLYFVPWFGLLRPNQLSQQLLESFRDHLLDKGLSGVTVNKHLNYLSSIINWSVNHKHCEPLPFRLPKIAKKRLTRTRVNRPLTRRQLDAIYKQIKPEFRLFFLLMADQGLRLDEARLLRAEDVDEEFQQLWVTGKGNKLRQVPFMTERFEREVDKALDKRIEGHLVVNEKTGKPYVTMRVELKRAVAAAGISRTDVNHHTLRHTFATLCAQSGMNPHALQRILGHSDITTTNRIYTAVSEDFVGQEARAMRQRLNTVSKNRDSST